MRLISCVAVFVIASSLGCGGQADAPPAPEVIVWSEAPAPFLRRSCTTPVAPDPLASSRAACLFGESARAEETLGLSEDFHTTVPIRHVIVLMKENRSFDHLLGHLHDDGQPLTEAIPESFFNLDLENVVVRPHAASTTCIAHDPAHQWAAMHAQIDGGEMDGFVKSAARSTGTNGHFVMSGYDAKDLPFYYWLASTYALNDRHFASARSGTFPNRDFLYLATADGVRQTGNGPAFYPDSFTPTLFEVMTTAGVSWGAYAETNLLDGTLGWTHADPNTYHLDEFLAELDAGTLPNVSFVDGRDELDDEHPDADVQRGEAWTRNIYEHAIASPLWSSLAIIWTYDEAGGFADHVPPPNQACVARPIPKDAPMFELGTRVPLTVISPYARAGYVSHVVQEHTAITRFIEAIFGLPALTARDANSDALLDLFDFDCPPNLAPPQGPPAGTGGCP